MNVVILAGNLGKDPELRYTASGKAVAKFSMATTKTYKGVKKTAWHTITAWGQLAEIAVKYLTKGSQAIVRGELGYNEWEKDGRKYSQAVITADEIQFGQKQRATDEEPPDDIPF
jgi:single-strand DNA-binding protein